MSTENDKAGQAPTDTGQAPTNDKAADDAADLRREAAGYRRQLREAQAELEALKRGQEEAARKQAEEQGKYRELYERTKATHEAAVSSFKAQVLARAKADALLSAGFRPEMVGSLTVDLSGVEVGDDFTVKGAETLAERAKALHGTMFGKPTEPAKAPADQGKPTIVIGERRGGNGAPTPVNIRSIGSAFAEYAARQQKG